MSSPSQSQRPSLAHSTSGPVPSSGFTSQTPAPSSSPESATPPAGDDLQMIPLSAIQLDGFAQHRVDLDPDRIASLAHNMADVGLLHPITVVLRGHTYVLVAGQHRCAAADSLGWATIQAKVLPASTPAIALITASENLEHATLSPFEEAHAIANIIQATDLTPQAVAARLHRSTAWVNSRLVLLTYHPQLQRAVHERILSLTAAANLAPIADEEHLLFLLKSAREHGCTAAVASSWRQTYEHMASGTPAQLPPPESVAHYSDPPKPTQICWACHKRDLMSAMTLVPMHGQCLAALTDSLHDSSL